MKIKNIRYGILMHGIFWGMGIAPIAFTALGLTSQLQAQENPEYTLQGQVSDPMGDPLEFATIAIVELKQKTEIGENGAYAIRLPAGEYTVIVSSPGMKPHRGTLQLSQDQTLDIVLEPHTIGGSSVTIEGERDIQKISRYTMAKEEMKNVPASFGDSLGAIATMAGIEQNGLFGSMAIRGLGATEHRFYVDGVPIREPRHFGALHSIINNEVVQEIDIYSSAFPVEYGAPIGSVLQFNTVDQVDKREIYADLSLLSLNATILSPIRKPDSSSSNAKTAGYWIIGGRYGYTSLFAPALVKAMTGDDGIEFHNIYYDYQFKGKYFLNKDHSITMLLFGGYDSATLDGKMRVKTKEELIDEGADPFSLDMYGHFDNSYHSQSITCTYFPSDKLKNEMKLYTSLNELNMHWLYKSKEVAEWGKGTTISTDPNIYGIKDDLYLDLFDQVYLIKAGADLTYYDFKASGNTIVPAAQNTWYIDTPDPADPDLYTLAEISQSAVNNTLGGYLENRVNYQGLTVAGGFRTDYLKTQNQTIFDPRGRASYTAPTETTISVAGGQYSSFFQTNVYYFEYLPQIFELDLKPERAVHRSAAIEQRFLEKYTITLEGYMNDFSDLVQVGAKPNVLASNLGEARTRGVEITVKKDKITRKLDYYGWMNYTYGISEQKSHRPADPLGEKWISGDFDRRHSLKAVSGIRYGASLLGLRFQYYSSYPETPIVGDDGGVAYTLSGSANPNRIRYAPAYGDKNSRFRSPQHQLDVRFSRTSQYKWGSLNWYVEVINIYNFKPDDTQEWAYNKPYSDNNPSYGSSADFAFLPNFGVEAKF